MPTIQDLFKQRSKEIYSKDNIRIESKGILNPPRAVALLAASPNPIADLVGGLISGNNGGGSANRPSDTIFRSLSPLAKPVSLLAPTAALLRDSIKSGRAYVVKTSPNPSNELLNIFGGGQSTEGIVASGIKQFGSVGAIKELASSLKIPKNESYHPRFGKNKAGKTKGAEIKNSEYKTVHKLDIEGNEAKGLFAGKSVKERTAKEKAGWSGANAYILEKEKFINEIDLNQTINENKDVNQVWVTFKKYGNKEIVPFAGAISGLSEDVTTEWSDVKYIGSPFKTYRYGGVERSLKFNLKVYYYTARQKEKMISKINYLKSLAFPYEEVSTMSYTEANSTIYNQYAFSPNLFYLSIGDMYKNVFGFVENISFAVDDNTIWPNANVNGNQEGIDPKMKIVGLEADTHLYPSVIDVSISMKIIENHKIEKGTGGITKYKYDFDGITNSDEYDRVFPISTPFVIGETKQ